MMFHRVYGVDFSGAKDAGRRIWIAGGRAEGDILRIDRCSPAYEWLKCGRDRKECLVALRRMIAGEKGGAFGLDFPFGLPRDLVKHKESWEDFVLSFPGDYATADSFRRRCLEAGEGRELKRVTDQEAKTPFSAYNLRLYRQTYYGIRDVLHPLVRDQQACVLPMQQSLPDRPWVLEICPASTLKLRWVDVYLPYKGRTDGHRAIRERILERLASTGRVSVHNVSVRSQILDDGGGDALDSVIAAFATFGALQDPSLGFSGDTNVCALEGYVYI
jgi:hypothetical protein